MRCLTVWLQSHVRTFEFYGGVPDLLVLDTLRSVDKALSAAHRNGLIKIMDDHYGNHTTVVLGQRLADQWYASIGDNIRADAILDRLMHNAYRLNLRGESMRKTQSKLTEDEHPITKTD